MQRNWWIDERQDPEKSTRAAASSEGPVQPVWRLVPGHGRLQLGPGHGAARGARTGYADFWELYRRNVLPGETRNYVPIILAMTIMAKNPTQYGLDQWSRPCPRSL